MQAHHPQQYRIGPVAVAVVLVALFVFVRADDASGRAAATLTVCKTGGATYKTINEAVTAAAKSGDRIEVCADTFTEQVVIKDKSVTLVGKGPSQTTIKAPAAFGPYGNIVEITGSGAVDLSGFTITGPGSSGCGSLLSGVFVSGGAHASIHDNHITSARDEPFSGCQNGAGVRVGADLSTPAIKTSGTATIADNTIGDYQKAGIFVDGEGSKATITGNTVTGHGSTDVIAQNGIEVVRGAGATVARNTVSANSYSPTDNEATGVLLFGALAATTISQNTMSDSELGIGAFNAMPAGDSKVVISANKVNGGEHGISLGAAQNLLIENNTIKGARAFGVYADSATSGNTFRGNDANAAAVALDCRDASKGDKTAHTANTWTANVGMASVPKPICTEKITVVTPPIIVLPPTQPPAGEQPPSGQQPPSGTQPPPPAPPPPAPPAPPAEREAVTVANEIIARMKNRKLKSCVIKLYGHGQQKMLLARGLAKAPPGGRGQLVVRIGLLPKGETVLSKQVGGAVVDVRAVCRTTSNKAGEKIKTARAVLQLEHATTPPGSWVPDKAILTPAGERFLKSLAKQMVAATRVRCDGHTAAWAPSAVDAGALSRARARLVCQRLKRKDVAIEIRVIPHGNAIPIATNTTESGRSVNRRVGITIVHPIAVRTPLGKR